MNLHIEGVLQKTRVDSDFYNTKENQQRIYAGLNALCLDADDFPLVFQQ